MKKKIFKKGEKIIEEGTYGKEMFVVVSGKLNVYKTINQEKIKLSELKADDFFGEMSLFLPVPRTATVEAIEDSEILIIKKDDFIEMIRERPELGEDIVSTMAHRIHELHNIIARLKGEVESLKIMYGIHTHK